jgi:serine/threonine-protein kinase ATR
MLTVVFSSSYTGLPDLAKIRIIHLIADLCCAADDSLTMTGDDGDEWSKFNCLDCRSAYGSLKTLACIDPTLKKLAMEMFASLLQIPAFSESRKPRVAAMVSLRRIAKHCNASNFLDMEASPAAQWCLKSLHSSLRELRIAAG